MQYCIFTNVRRKLTSDDMATESQAGYFLALISSQLGFKWNDFLRQVIKYEFPNNKWEKDNFTIRTEYRELVKEVLRNLGK
jgi:hypothetical protein